MPKKNKYWQITNVTDDSADILLYGFIGDEYEDTTGKQIAKALRPLKDKKALNVHINSPGGFVFEGLAIYNLLNSHPAWVNVHIDGLAASIASVIAMAGDRVIMPANAMMMIHDPSGMVMGTAKDMKKMAEALEKMKSALITAYMAKSGMPEDAIAGMMEDETWISAHEAVSFGLADEVTESVKIAAHFDLSQFKNAPQNWPIQAVSWKDAYFKAEDPKITSQGGNHMVITIDSLRNDAPDVYTGVFEAGATSVQPAIATAKTEAAEAERARIRAVRDQLLPGHEALIETLMFDGVTTGEQAALRVLQAEKQVRAAALQKIVADAPVPVKTVDAAPEPPKREETFEDRVDAYMADNKCRKSEAIAAVAKAHPELHRKYIENVNRR